VQHALLLFLIAGCENDEVILERLTVVVACLMFVRAELLQGFDRSILTQRYHDAKQAGVIGSFERHDY
jgi:hypothetical protein